MPNDLIYLNGIDGVTGQYLVPPTRVGELAKMARGSRPATKLAARLKSLAAVLAKPFLGLPLDVDPTDVAKAGWAVVFPTCTPSEVRKALEPLIAHRQNRVPPDRCKVLDYKPGEDVATWLERHDTVAGNVLPKKVPYYLTLVGSPTEIPFEFQYLLDLEYAVGRLAFEGPEGYRQYAESVVEYETSNSVPNAKEIVYWGTRHEGDGATKMSADCLLKPLSAGTPAADGQDEEKPIAEVLSYGSRSMIGQDGTKEHLTEVLQNKARATPAFLFTASHGMGWPQGDAQQQLNGALLCQDWTGFGTIKPEHYLTAANIPDDARLHGLVAFLFACYGAGTPAFDNFLKDREQGPQRVADQPFVGKLPQRLLSHPQGSALAVVGHVERAWGYSIQPPGVGPQLVPFRNLIGRVLGGEPVGHATKDFSERYATLSTQLLSDLDATQPGKKPTDEELVWLWVERNDAQNYVVLGDPAVQVRVDQLQ
jgi:hypothetical protein